MCNYYYECEKILWFYKAKRYHIMFGLMGKTGFGFSKKQAIANTWTN